MSDSPDEQDGEQSDPPDDESEPVESSQPQAEQPEGGQPHAGPTQGGQPQGGQPQGGQPQAGQPQGAYQAQQPAPAGPTVSDIFSRQDTMARMKEGTVLMAMVGVGLLVASALGSFISYGQATAVTQGALILGPAAAAVFAFRDADILGDVPNNLVYATTAVTAVAETLVLVILGMFGGIMAAGLGGQQTATVGGETVTVGQVNFPAGDFFLVGIMVAVGAALIAVLVVWAKRNVLAPGPMV